MTEINVNWTIASITELAKQFPDVVREETVKCMQVVTGRLEKDVVEGTPAGVGGAAGLRGSIHGQVEMTGNTVRGSVSTSMPYGDIVEIGRKAGSFPPVAPIALWASRKLGVFDTDLESAAFLIARKIYREGTKGAHMFETAWNKDQDWVWGQMQNIVPAVLRRVNGL